MPELIEVDPRRPFPRTFVPTTADLGDWAQIEPLFGELLRREPASLEELERWLRDCSELAAGLQEEQSKRYIAMTTQTDDPDREAAFQHFVEQITPKAKPLAQELSKAYLRNPSRKLLPKERYAVLDRKTENFVALFREENVPLETQDELLAKDYQKIMGAMTVTVNGAELTLQQASKLLEELDRVLRRQVWEQITTRQLEDRERLDAIFDQLVALRTQIAANAGFASFRDYIFPARERFDYTPDDCFRFHDGVEQAVMPLAGKIQARRQRLLGLDNLRPWDLAVDPLNRPPLRPFSTAAELVQGARKVFDQVHPALGEQFQFMADQELLELESRKGKAPGGYQSSLTERRWPFIFMNAVGRDLDLRTLVHEGGHAFHCLATREEPLFDYRHAPIEFCEVASMGMELLATPHLEVFYKDSEECRRAYRSRLEDIVLVLPRIAAGDAFQHWVYTHPAHTREERANAWLQLHARFSPVVDWTGYDEQRSYSWHPILHFFQVPFYFVEYAIAQIGALQVWLRSKKNYREAVERYWSALALGGSRPLPELFAAAGAQFRFDYEALEPLMDVLGEELERLE